MRAIVGTPGSRRSFALGAALDARLERAYERLGPRYLPSYIALFIISITGIVLFGTVVLSRYQRMSAFQFAVTLAFGEVAMVASLSAGAWRVMRQAEPLQAWLRAGRPAAGAEAALRAALRYTPTGVRTQFVLAVALVALPGTLFLSREFDYTWHRGVLIFVGLIAASTYPTTVSFFLTEIVLRPPIRDAGRALGQALAAPAAGMTLRTKVMISMTVIGIVTSGFASVAATLASGGSIDQLGVDVALGILAATTTSLLLAWLVTRALIGPIDDLLAATRQLRTGDLSVRVPIVASDELGMVTQSFNEMVEALADREALHARATALELEAERLSREAERAVLDERARIARELHDVIAHNVGMMVLQADGAVSVLDTNPERARSAMDTIGVSGRQALTELRNLLGVLRRSDEGSRSPQPTLSDLDALADDIRRTGHEVQLTLELDRRLPPAIELSAFRIIQEAFTNVVKHASASRVTVDVRSTGTMLELRIADNGTQPTPVRRASAQGHGLIGMRERVELLGGTIDVGPDPQIPGFVIRARLPIDASDGPLNR